MDMEEKKDDEREVWEFMTPLAWHNSIAEKDSVFVDTPFGRSACVEDVLKSLLIKCFLHFMHCPVPYHRYLKKMQLYKI